MFMRYISHEMRTPLNVACLGIKILRGELERLGLLSLLETAIDTEKSCKTAVDILNDMLLFDKIVSGLMTLEKRLIDPVDFIAKVLGPFHLQVDYIYLLAFSGGLMSALLLLLLLLLLSGPGCWHRSPAGAEHRPPFLGCSTACGSIQDLASDPQLVVECS